MGGAISERTVVIDGIEVFLRERPGAGTPTVFVHGNPTSSFDWLPFLERLEGPALAFDLPGFGRSARPDPSAFDHSMGAYADLIEALLDELAPAGYCLVVHDWGGVALAAAQRHPERVERLVVINAVPLSSSYRWHWLARLWRRRGVGEAFNAATSRFAVAQLTRLARPGRRPMPRWWIDEVWSTWDAGTRRAILGLYRSADPAVLAAAGAELDRLTCRSLIIWGTADPYIGVEQGRWYASVLADAELAEIGGAGHWPWIDRPEVIERVCGFLEPPD